MNKKKRVNFESKRGQKAVARNEERERERERESGRGGGLSAGGMEGEESVIPDDQRAADSALMSSSNDK